MAAVQYFLGATAALVFLLIGLEEYPIRFNVERVLRSVRSRARRRAQDPLATLAWVRAGTRRSVWILVAFALASGALLGVFIVQAPPGTREGDFRAPLHIFSLVLVLGLVFLVFAFARWAPRLFDQVERRLEPAPEGSNAAPRLGGP